MLRRPLFAARGPTATLSAHPPPSTFGPISDLAPTPSRSPPGSLLFAARGRARQGEGRQHFSSQAGEAAGRDDDAPQRLGPSAGRVAAPAEGGGGGSDGAARAAFEGGAAAPAYPEVAVKLQER